MTSSIRFFRRDLSIFADLGLDEMELARSQPTSTCIRRCGHPHRGAAALRDAVERALDIALGP